MRCFVFITMLSLLYSKGVTAGNTFGRLFFTIEQREALDRLRDIEPQSATLLQTPEQAHEAIGVRSPKRPIQGYVKRSDTHQLTVWVNGEALKQE